jgi:hypothetical protein
MLADAGFTDVEVFDTTRPNRMYACQPARS